MYEEWLNTLKVKEGDFFASYLRVDEDGDTVMKALPVRS